MTVKGTYELRSGLCEVCGTPFDPSEKPLVEGKRYCLKCKQYRLGKLKQTGKIKGRK